MKSTLTAAMAALCLALTLGGCATPGTDPKAQAQATVDKITLAYAPVKLAATLCATGVVCSDEGVIDAVSKAIPVADEAVAKAKEFIVSHAGDPSSVSKWTDLAMDAIAVLAKALSSYGVKVA